MDAIRDWWSTLSIESMGLVGLVTPSIETVIDLKTGRIDHYTAGKMCMFRGEHCDFDPDDVNQGIWLITAGGPVGGTRVDTYGVLSPGEGSFLMPAGTTGSVTLRMVTFINGSLRSTTYTTPLEP